MNRSNKQESINFKELLPSLYNPFKYVAAAVQTNKVITGKMGKGRAFYLKKELFNKYFYEGNLMLGINDEGIVSLKESGNQNVLVVGKTGIGKTSTYSVPNILVEQEKSLIVIDPARELYQQTHFEKGNQGYNVETKSLSECHDGVLKHLVQQLFEKKTILYLHVNAFHHNASEEERVRKLFKLLYEFITNTKKRYHDVHVLFEEASGYKMPDLLRLLETCNSYQVQFSLVIQTVDCLNRLYGKEAAKSILNSCPMKLLMGTESMEEAEYFSSLIGRGMSPKEILYMPHEKSLLTYASGSQIIDKLPVMSRFE